MKTFYLFTDITGKKIIELNNQCAIGMDAVERRSQLQRKHQMPIIAWAIMGEDNPKPEIE